MLVHVLILLGCNIALTFALMIALWLVGLKTRDVTFVDAFWALNMVFLAVGTWFWTPDGDPLRKALLVGLCALWGVRLGGYLLWRWRSHGPDRRYRSMLGKAESKGVGFARASLTMVFLTQAPMLFIVCLPVQLGQIASAPPVGIIAWIGVALALVGVVFESVGDCVEFLTDFCHMQVVDGDGGLQVILTKQNVSYKVPKDPTERGGEDAMREY